MKIGGVDERIDPEAKDNQGHSLNAAVNRSETLGKVVENREERQPEGLLPVFVDSGASKSDHGQSYPMLCFSVQPIV